MNQVSVPEKFKSQHLFLLVGTNPLPDWVATQLLLQPGGQLYLICSQTTEPVAGRLARFALSKGFPQPQYVKVDNPFAAGPIRRAIQDKLRELTPGSLGFNYTGGTKAMATQGYETLKHELPVGWPEPVFSYVEAEESTLHFDPHSQHCPMGDKHKISLSELQLSLNDVLALHGDFGEHPLRQTVQGEKLFPLLLDIHLDKDTRGKWREHCEGMLKEGGGRKRKNKSKTGLQKTWLALPEFPELAEKLITGGSSGQKTLDDVWQAHGFDSIGKFATWLDGPWLEHYVLKLLHDRQEDYHLQEFTQSLETKQPIKFEVDVVAMRGYQLHVLSCYSDGERGTAKLKLFEALMRARYLGGDAARAALVCFCDDPTLEQEIGELWVLKEQVKVFGRNELYNLSDHLYDWFAKGSQKA